MSQQLNSDYMLDPCLFLRLHKHLHSKPRDICMLPMLRKPEDATTSHTWILTFLTNQIKP